jgi:hypothetical protein
LENKALSGLTLSGEKEKKRDTAGVSIWVEED